MNNNIKLIDKDREIEHLKRMNEIGEKIINIMEANTQFDKERIQYLEAELSARGKFSNKQLEQSFSHLKVHHS